MQWMNEVATGDWLRDRIDDPWRGTMHDVVPRGFPAYARVFHPTTRSKPIGREWPPQPAERHRAAWDRFAREQPEIQTVPTTWHQTADAFGTTMHPLVQWGALVKATGAEWNPGEWRHATSPDGWQYDAPNEGELDAEVLSALMRHLPGALGYAALWEGWGDLVGHTSIGTFRSEAADPDQQRTDEIMWASTADVLNRPYATPSWQPGTLSDEISRGNRLSLPGRDYVLFAGDLAVFADPSWPEHVPWADERMRHAHSPAILWPSDHDWVLITEIDWDSTIVGGSAELVAAICADDAIEALPLQPGASLQWDADTLNR